MKKMILLMSLPLVFAMTNPARAGDSVKINTSEDDPMGFGNFGAVQQNLHNMMGNFMGNMPMGFQALRMDNAGPKADVIENKDNIEVKIDLPGAKKGNVEVLVFEDNVTLKVTNETKTEKKDDKSYYLSERSFGVSQRVIPLPADVNYEKAESDYKDGVLTITIPKLEEQKPKYKKITI